MPTPSPRRSEPLVCIRLPTEQANRLANAARHLDITVSALVKAILVRAEAQGLLDAANAADLLRVADGAQRTERPTPRLVTLDEIMSDILPLYMRRLPHPETVRLWLQAARIPFMKANRRARNGGGRKYYQEREVKRFFKERSGLA